MKIRKSTKVILIVLCALILIVSGYFLYSLFLKGDFFSFLQPPINPEIDKSSVERSEPGTGYYLPAELERSGEIVLSQDSQYGLKILKNGSISLIVDKGKFFEVWNRISFEATSLSGYVSGSNYSRQDNDYYYGTISVIIPAKDFDNFTATLTKLGKVVSLNVLTKDVSGEYVDLSSRLKVLEEQRNLLLGWLTEAKTVQDMIALRNEIQSVETEIETTKGRMNYIEFHTEYSEVTIGLSEKETQFLKPGPFTPIVEGLKVLYNALIKSLFGLLFIVVILLPWGIVAYLVYREIRRRKARG